ncbi:hypothetical protein PR048_009917 [Dryococelus australis]|uniref:Uncharacterized protein n=1 Tax=Dryococelus australis TaxID=614101 RepID=A0ABQ9I271_9NEOP|nr:hypothetical protein PR048_009917 [Dryococelus australis]
MSRGHARRQWNSVSQRTLFLAVCCSDRLSTSSSTAFLTTNACMLCHCPPRPFCPLTLSLRGRSGVVVRLLTSNLRVPGSIPGGVAPGFSHVEFVSVDAAGRRVFSGISCFPRSFIPALLHSPLFTLIGSQDLVVKSHSNHFRHFLFPLHLTERCGTGMTPSILESGTGEESANYPNVHLEKLRETMEHLNQDGRTKIRTQVLLTAYPKVYHCSVDETYMTNARLHHRGSKLDPRSTQKTFTPFEFRAGLEIEMKFISIRDQQPSSKNWNQDQTGFWFGTKIIRSRIGEDVGATGHKTRRRPMTPSRCRVGHERQGTLQESPPGVALRGCIASAPATLPFKRVRGGSGPTHAHKYFPFPSADCSRANFLRIPSPLYTVHVHVKTVLRRIHALATLQEKKQHGMIVQNGRRDRSCVHQEDVHGVRCKLRRLQASLGSPLVDDRPIMNAVKYRVVPSVVWTNRSMVSSNTDTNKIGVVAVVDIDTCLTLLEFLVRSEECWVFSFGTPVFFLHIHSAAFRNLRLKPFFELTASLGLLIRVGSCLKKQLAPGKIRASWEPVMKSLVTSCSATNPTLRKHLVQVFVNSRVPMEWRTILLENEVPCLLF